MSKPSYSEEEVENASNSTDTEVQKLKKLLLHYKKKYEAAEQEKRFIAPAQTYIEKGIQESETGDLLVRFSEQAKKIQFMEQHLTECQKSLEETRRQCAGFEEENTALRGQQTILKQMLHTAKEDYRKSDHELGLALQKIKTTEIVRSDLDKSVHALQNKLTEAEKAKENVLREQAEQLSNHNSDYKKQIEHLEEDANRMKARIEKLAALLTEKDKRIQELQQLEYGLKKGHEQKQLLEIELDKSYHQTLHLKEKIEKLEQALETSLQHAQQLERANHYLRERMEETHLVNVQLQENYQSGTTLINTLQQQVHDQTFHVETLHAAIAKEKVLQEEGAEEILALRGQCEQLRKHVQLLMESKQADASSLESQQKALEAAISEKAALEHRLTELQQNIEEFEKETSLIKQTLLKGLRETKEIEGRYLDAVNEKILTGNKYHQLQQHLERVRDESRMQKTELQKAEEQKNILREQYEQQLKQLAGEHQTVVEKISLEIEEVKTQYQKAVQEHNSRTKDLQNHLLVFEEALKKKEEEISALNAKLTGSYVEKNKLQEQLLTAQQQAEDKDTQLKGAQQHLAKKVKEYSQLSEKAEEQKQQINELQNSLNHTRERISDLQTSLENQQQQEKRLQDQLHETTKSFEVQIGKWEEKYFQMHEKGQNSDNRIKELEKFEEKHRQMQALLSNLGSFMGTTPAMLQPETIAPTPPKIAPPVFEEPAVLRAAVIEPEPIKAEKPVESAKPYQNLFDMPRPSQRPKKDLLD